MNEEIQSDPRALDYDEVCGNCKRPLWRAAGQASYCSKACYKLLSLKHQSASKWKPKRIAELKSEREYEYRKAIANLDFEVKIRPIEGDW